MHYQIVTGSNKTCTSTRNNEITQKMNGFIENLREYGNYDKFGIKSLILPNPLDEA